MGDDATVQARPRLASAVPGAAVGDPGDRDKRPTATSPRTSAGGHRFAARTRGGDGGGSPRGSPGTPTPYGTPPGTALERKKSYHPELLTGMDCPVSASERRELFVLPRDAAEADLGHRMELIHLNRTCTSVDLASASPAAPHDLRGTTSDANLTNEEKVHRVRHQVSFAQGVGHVGPGRPAFHGQDLVNALRHGLRTASQEAPGEEDSDQDENPDEDGNPFDNVDMNTFRRGSDALLEAASNASSDRDLDYLAVRPSLASTQLTQLTQLTQSTQLTEPNELRGPHSH